MISVKKMLGMGLVLIVSHTISAQSDDCFLGISTNPSNPVNTICPGKLNTFDWRISKFDVPTSWHPDGQVDSPYWQIANSPLLFLSDGRSSTHHDFLHEDGWELLAADMRVTTFPFLYLVMYNKYESLIRVFRTFAFQDQNNYVALSLRFGNGLTGLLSPNRGHSQPMDSPSIRRIRQSSSFSNFFDRWVYFDIPVEYDPCTCSRAINSNLYFEFYRVNSQVLEIYGRYVATNQSLGSIVNVGLGGVERYPEEFLASIDEGGDVAGTSTFKHWEDLLEHHRLLKEEIEPYKKKYAQLQNLDKVLSIGLKTAVGGDLLKSLKILKVLDASEEEDDVYITGKDALEVTLGGLNLFGAGIKKKIDALNGQIGALGSTTLTHGEMVLRGTLSTQFDDLPFILDLPGMGNADCQSNFYPLYNEVLGRMAVLNTPVVKDNVFQVADISSFPSGARQFQLAAGSLQYTFNPAAGVDEGATKIYGALRISSNSHLSIRNATPLDDEGKLHMTPLVPIECLSEYKVLADIANSTPSAVSAQSISVELIMFVSYVFEGGKQAIQQYTYPTTLDQTFQLVQPSVLFSYPTSQLGTPAYQAVLDVNARTHFPNADANLNLLPNLFFAYSEINIRGAQQTQPGVMVEFVSPQIIVHSNADLLLSTQAGLTTEILLRDGDYPTACEPLLPASAAEVVTFCASNQYAGNRSNAQPDDEMALQSGTSITPPLPIAEREALLPEQLELNISPNPVGDYASIRLLLPDDESVHLSIIDMSGRSLRTLLDGRTLPMGIHYFDLPAANLKPGTYLLRATTGQGVEVLRFVR